MTKQFLTEPIYKDCSIITDESDAIVLSPTFWSIFKKNRISFMSFWVFVLFFIIAVTGLFLTYGNKPLCNPSMIRLEEALLPPMTFSDRNIIEADRTPPFNIYLLGTDDLGRDIFSRMLQGAWVSLTVGFVAVGISVIIGIIMGGIAGFYSETRIPISMLLICLLILAAAPLWFAGSYGVRIGISISLLILVLIKLFFKNMRFFNVKTFSIDTLIMGFVDIMLCFPSFFLILTVVAILPASIYNIMVVIGLTSWMGTARFVRAEFLSLKKQDFVTAAFALGVGNIRIIFRHMMPNAVAPVLVSATIGIASAILTEAGLSFLGFGVPPPYATWGSILSDGKRFIFDAPWLTFIPGFAILIVVLCFNLFGEGLRDALNPKLRDGRNEKR